MLRHRRFIIGGLIILAALSYIIYGGMQETIVYFVTPSELKAKESASTDKFLRMGGMWSRDRCKKTSRISPIAST
jgi:cytochrome c-type biogenesis protein CcmE